IVRFILFSIPAVETKARRHARAYLAVLAIAPLTVLGLAVVRYSAPFAMTQRTMAAIMITWTILGNLVVAYAILWHQAFGVERKLKVTLQRGTIVAAFVLVFLVAAQFLQAFVDTYSWFWSGLVAALVLFAVRPLSRLGLRLAEAAMPDVDDTPVYRAYRRIQVYESALMAAWEDGKLKSEERSRLEHLRRRLELPTADAKAIERDFVATMASRNVPFAT
ncbi:MAG TPA: hypothetical protein VI818_02210, partial [Candidatus Thermoplasmatota archaeon]|nr:hypothetical protein [Candidatus Thermoplasmatota archaeon]